jgi:hypothetical protein
MTMAKDLSGADSQEDTSELEGRMNDTPIPSRHKSSMEGSSEHRFEADEWGRLTLGQRQKHCHRMADEAQTLAMTAPSEIAAAYLKIANDWLQLAAEIQKAGFGRGQEDEARI